MDSIKNYFTKQLSNNEFQKKYSQLTTEILNNKDIQQFIIENNIPKHIVEKSYSKLFEFVKEIDNIKKGLPSQNVGFEPKLAWNNQFIDVVYVPTKEYLLNQEKQKVLNRIQTLAMPKSIKQYRLKDVEVVDNRYEFLTYLADFNDSYNGMTSLKGAYVYGSYGIGKTYLLGALAGSLAQKGYSSYLVHFPSLIVELKAAIGENTVNDRLIVLQKTPILMIDDIGGENMTPWVRDDILMTLLDYRMREQLPTFFSSNLSFDALTEHLKGTTVEDERKSLRIMERIKALSIPFQLTGANRRQ